MWFREFKDYPIDTPLRKNKLEPGKGIVGCEMHDLMGWGNQIHEPPRPRQGLIATLLNTLFGGDGKKK